MKRTPQPSEMTDLLLDWTLLGDNPLAIAVSGGADSFALLHACIERGLPVVALTVDHGLREGSTEDARVVAGWCAERSVPHETLRWAGEKPETGVQDAARTARYRLLCEACERLGLERLAAGHTLDDQAETVFMRLRRGAGRGLAGMPPSRKIASGPGEPVTLLRPMLGGRRAAARAYAEAHGLPVRDDPSNENEAFERVRVRGLLAALEAQGTLDAEALARTAARTQETEHVLASGVEWSTSDIGYLLWLKGREPARDCVFFADLLDGWSDRFVVPEILDLIEDWDREVVRRFVGAVGGAAPDHSLAVPAPGDRLTANGVIMDWSAVPEMRAGAPLRIYREPAALLGRADGTPGLAPVPAPPGSRHLYDRRFIVYVPGDAPPDTELRPLGQLIPCDIATSTLFRSRVSTLPCLSIDGRVTHLPSAAIRAVREAFGGWKKADDFLSSSIKTFDTRSLLGERFANEVIRY